MKTLGKVIKSPITWIIGSIAIIVGMVMIAFKSDDK